MGEIYMSAKVGVWRQRLGYGIADFSCNLIWQMITLYLMFFYTDVMGLAAVQVGMLFLLTRVVDGIADVCMGVLIDKTNTRWGKSRPYFLIGAIPFGLLAILAFYVPDIGPVGKLVYAYFTYLGLSLAYTMVNIPMASILPSLTNSAQERTMLATTRIIFSFIGATAVSAFTLPLVKALGSGSQAQGFFWTIVIFAVVGTLMFFVTFKNVEEKVKIQQEKVTVKQAFSTLKGNVPWYIFAINIIFMWGSYFFQQGALIYYFTYNVGRADLATVVASISSFVPIVGTFVTPFFAKLMYKRKLFIIASTINLAGMGVMLIANVNVTWLIIGAIIVALGHGLRQSIYFSMQADPVDYGEWKTGISAAGIISALNGFIGKIAMAGAGAISGWLLTHGHYVPNRTQTNSALFAIKLNYLIIPAGMVVISMIIMCFYNLDKIYPKIRAEIDKRHEEENAEEKSIV
ncbi:glycoside-pentoside-hexuronide (GPH):cation symporter [Priestia sp. P5]|uniref:glycoside-pentoside-hexuronide (GPH):cation symporter n=1 Tax=Priestia sp. P5 TaxID=2917806 RepID=UPI0024073A0B|nr:glycoside-pentoside-hexuronide (GPH):cation symporter [Priestia sp. P5]MDG0062019.1 glycoside-pentoside-hexuronide (GPH):cation symporter [Priestia sp. P5]